MDNFSKQLQFLFSLQRFGIKLGLENIKLLLKYLGNPHRRFPCIHIAGTNGKGSTAAMLASVLTASGYRTGLYTSPHIVDFRERIRIDGHKIPLDVLSEYTKSIRKKVQEIRSTFFEATTAIAFQYFAEQDVDIGVIETGLGGRYDATNVLSPLFSIITNVEIEHTDRLGRTYSSIAWQKGGIIKSNTVCLTGTTNPEAIDTLKQIAIKENAKLIQVSTSTAYELIERSLYHMKVNIQTASESYKNIQLSLVGDHQIKNLQLAISGLEILKDNGFSKITSESIYKGLKNIKKYTGFSGRLDLLCDKPIFIADVAHNPNGVETLLSSLKKLLVGRFIIIFGIMKDKDIQAIIKILSPVVDYILPVTIGNDRALSSSEILKYCHRLKCRAINGKSIENAISLALMLSNKEKPILCVGSHYLIGELYKFLGEYS